MPSFEPNDLQITYETNEDPEEETERVDASFTVINSDTSQCKGSKSNATSSSPSGLCAKEDSSSISEEDDIIAEEDKNDDDLPVDKGWAWIVLAGCFLNIGLVLGYIRGLSILFLEYLRIFNASTAKTTLLMGVNAGVYSISALLSMHILVGTVGVRKTLFIGAGITVIGMAVAIAPTSIDFLIGTHSILLGIGNSMIFGPSVVAVRQYFKSKYGFASAVAMAGDSLGGGLFPLLIRYLLDEYGLRGTMIILTGLSMNIFVGAAACIPLQSFRKKQKSKRLNKTSSVDRESQNLNERAALYEMTDLDCSPQEVIKLSREDRIVFRESPFLVEKRTRTDTNNSSLSLSSRNMVLNASRTDLGSVVSVLDPPTLQTEETEVTGKGKTASHVSFKNLLSTLDFTLFKYPIFVLVVSYSFFNIIVALNGDYLPALAAEKGISQQDAAFFLTILGAMDFVGRFCVGVVIDKGYIRVNNLMAIGLILVGTTSQFTHFFNSYAVLLVFSVIIGLSTSTYFGLCPAAIVEFMGVEYMAKTVGFASLFHGMSVAIANPIIGSIRDSTGSYTGGYNYIGVCCCIGATLLLCKPVISRYSNRNKKESIQVHVE